MTRESSQRLVHAQYLQSDIAFKRVAGFLEFETGGLDQNAQIALTYCRVYVNRQSAAAHHIIFQRLEQIVEQDTGESLKWRHLHSRSLNDPSGVLQWTGDQHGGQAKGLGLHLKSLAAKLPLRNDLHEPHRTLASLDEYDHLRRIFRLCHVHVARNIRDAAVPESVKNKMRSLICMEHNDLRGCLQDIAHEGGKVGADWVQDKIRSKFALPGICWQESFIPKLVWQVGESSSNIIESLHADANTEGTSCTLVGGVKKGQSFDKMKLQSLQVYETTGIRPSYKRGHISDNIVRGVKRKMNNHHKALTTQDCKIESANKRLKAAKVSVDRAEERVIEAHKRAAANPDNEKVRDSLERATRTRANAGTTYTKAVGTSIDTIGTGSGHVMILLPAHVADKTKQK